MRGSSKYGIRSLYFLIVLQLGSKCAVKAGLDNSSCVNTTADYFNHCPTWFIPRLEQDEHTLRVSCECGPNDFFIHYDQITKKTYLRSSHCITFDSSSNLTYVGACPYNVHPYDNGKQLSDLVLIPNTTAELNDFMCGRLNRTGLLCSQCKDGLGPAVLSYTGECVECLDSRYGWLLYVVLTVLPTTLLCVVIIVVRFDATSPSMNFFIIACQILLNKINNHPSTFINYGKANSFYYTTLVLMTFYGFWNLDFFRYLIPPFCISSQMNTLQVIALDYTVAVYPLLLTAVVYYCIEFHDRGNRMLMWMWRPFQRCFICIRNTGDIKGSVVNAFATFLLLSVSKFVAVSSNLLYPVLLHTVCDTNVFLRYVYIDAKQPYFGSHHLPYAILAASVSVMFIVLPTLFLLFYHTTYLYECSSRSRRLRLTLINFIHELTTSIQGCYKDGTNGTRDYRSFAGFYMILRIYFLSITGSPYESILEVMGALLASTLFALLQPYKKENFNKLDSAMFTTVTMILVWILYSKVFSHLPVWPVAFVACIPFTYFILYCSYKIMSKRVHKVIKQACYSLMKCLKKCKLVEDSSIETEEESDYEPSRRLLYPSEYQPLTVTHT